MTAPQQSDKPAAPVSKLEKLVINIISAFEKIISPAQANLPAPEKLDLTQLNESQGEETVLADAAPMSRSGGKKAEITLPSPRVSSPHSATPKITGLKKVAGKDDKPAVFLQNDGHGHKLARTALKLGADNATQPKVNYLNTQKENYLTLENEIEGEAQEEASLPRIKMGLSSLPPYTAKPELPLGLLAQAVPVEPTVKEETVLPAPILEPVANAPKAEAVNTPSATLVANENAAAPETSIPSANTLPAEAIAKTTPEQANPLSSTSAPVESQTPDILSPQPTEKPVAVEPTEKPIAVEPTEKLVAVEPTEKPVAVEPTEKPIAVEPTQTPDFFQPIITPSETSGKSSTPASQALSQPSSDITPELQMVSTTLPTSPASELTSRLKSELEQEENTLSQLQNEVKAFISDFKQQYEQVSEDIKQTLIQAVNLQEKYSQTRAELNTLIANQDSFLKNVGKMVFKGLEEAWRITDPVFLVDKLDDFFEYDIFGSDGNIARLNRIASELKEATPSSMFKARELTLNLAKLITGQSPKNLDEALTLVNEEISRKTAAVKQATDNHEPYRQALAEKSTFNPTKYVFKPSEYTQTEKALKEATAALKNALELKAQFDQALATTQTLQELQQTTENYQQMVEALTKQQAALEQKEVRLHELHKQVSEQETAVVKKIFQLSDAKLTLKELSQQQQNKENGEVDVAANSSASAATTATENATTLPEPAPSQSTLPGADKIAVGISAEATDPVKHTDAVHEFFGTKSTLAPETAPPAATPTSESPALTPNTVGAELTQPTTETASQDSSSSLGWLLDRASDVVEFLAPFTPGNLATRLLRIYDLDPAQYEQASIGKQANSQPEVSHEVALASISADPREGTAELLAEQNAIAVLSPAQAQPVLSLVDMVENPADGALAALLDQGLGPVVVMHDANTAIGIGDNPISEPVFSSAPSQPSLPEMAILQPVLG